MLAVPFTTASDFSFISNAPSGASAPIVDTNPASYGQDLIFGYGFRVLNKVALGIYFQVMKYNVRLSGALPVNL